MWILAILLLIGVAFVVVDVLFSFYDALSQPPVFRLSSDVLFHMFGDFLIVLMGLKLIKLVLLSMPGQDSPILAVVEVALIAVGQKVVTMDLKSQSAAQILGVASLILALSVAYGVCSHIKPNRMAPSEADQNDTAINVSET